MNIQINADSEKNTYLGTLKFSNHTALFVFLPEGCHISRASVRVERAIAQVFYQENNKAHRLVNEKLKSF